MFRGLVAAGLGVLLLVACGSPPVAPHSASSRVACVDAGAPHHAYVVVQHMSGAWLQQCVGFGPDIIDGETIMDRSGIAFDAPRAASTRLMCRVDLEPSADVACGRANQALLGRLRGIARPLDEARHLHRGPV